MTKMRTRFMARSVKCGVCYGAVSFQGKLDCCLHVFCFDCITKWANKENTCPLCKKRFYCVKRVPHRVEYAATTKQRQLTVSDRNQDNPLDIASLIEAVQSLLTQLICNHS